jgi:hypothetical protein
MKIVGLISDEEELNEMENIAKVFVVEQRMKAVSKAGRTFPIFRRNQFVFPHKMNLVPHHLNHPLSSVRGLT